MNPTSVSAPIETNCKRCGKDLSGSCPWWHNGAGPLCTSCARPQRALCPDCGLAADLVDRPHVCRVPQLVEAIGCELTEDEMRFVRWLAKYGEAAVLIGILEKVNESR